MTQRRPIVGLLVAAVVVLVGMISACADGSDEQVIEVEVPGAAPPGLIESLGGPQGRVPQLVVECFFSHSSFDDPIVYPGDPGASHLHHFFGNHSTDANSTYESLIAADTTCNDQQDTAAYWTPALLDDGREVEPTKAVIYYRPGLDVDPAAIEVYPPGMAMISRLTAWTCGSAGTREQEPPECPSNRSLHLVVVFPDCWNGKDLDSIDHTVHVAYSGGGTCPDSHPRLLPQLTLTIEYPISGSGHDLSLSSGDLSTAHADFINSWNQEKLEADLGLCLARNVVCGVSR